MLGMEFHLQAGLWAAKQRRAPEEPNVYGNKRKTMRAPEERHQGTMSDAAPAELITFSIRYYKHWAPPEPNNWPNSRVPPSEGLHAWHSALLFQAHQGKPYQFSRNSVRKANAPQQVCESRV
jgi:hypothetical protein